MLVNVQISTQAITFNGVTLENLLEQAAKKGAEMAMKQPEDPLEMVALTDLAKKFGCCVRTMTNRVVAKNLRTYKQGRNICIFKKDVEKLLRQV